jgi:hypothetical protein
MDQTTTPGTKLQNFCTNQLHLQPRTENLSGSDMFSIHCNELEQLTATLRMLDSLLPGHCTINICYPYGWCK